jgi:adenosylmethionine-8-amino-7-oxononanoate aminotransferase
MGFDALNEHLCWDELLDFDRRHVWHPYASMTNPLPALPVAGARGVYLELADGRRLIDGMASWWCAIHGYRHPALDAAVREQLESMAHVMFGGLTHRPAVELAQRLVALTPDPLRHVFFADSGSVAVEVAVKMAVQYGQGRGAAGRHRLLTVRHGYHGDTLAAMSVCDPQTGMHHLFRGVVPQQFFAPAPQSPFGGAWEPADIEPMAALMERHRDELAAVILEPVVQGAGGMRFYHPQYLRELRALCDEHGVLLIFDEIATGFGRTGRLFALEHAGVTPDILCLGKALTGGYLTLAAVLTTAEVAAGVSSAGAGCLMHGPTFMANPLACRVACASIDLLRKGDWAGAVARIETGLRAGLGPCADLPGVADVRVLGAIGVVELRQPVDLRAVTPRFVSRGVWLRPFGRLVYTMPPYVIGDAELEALTGAIVEVVEEIA